MDNPSSTTSSQVLRQLQSSLQGLSSQEVVRRRHRSGANILLPRPPISAWRIFCNQFSGFIIQLLLFAVCFSLLIGEYTDALVIVAMLVMNGCIGFIQELKANRSLEALLQLVTITARVRRGGQESRLDAAELVPGDIILLEPGDRVPADARLLESLALQLEEASLTGESMSVAKSTSVLAPGLSPGDQRNMVFASTAVVGGRGVAVVTATAMETEIGKISAMLSATPSEETPLQRRLDRFGRRLGRIIGGLCILVFLLLLGRVLAGERELTTSLFIDFAFVAISLAVAAVPTALPAVVTISLSVGTRRLLKREVLVRRLTSVETLGSCDVICTDKTGTLTMNTMNVVRGWTSGGLFEMAELRERGPVSTAERLLFMIGQGCNNGQLAGESDSGRGTPTEQALLLSGRQAGVEFAAERLGELPFDSLRKRMSVLVRGEQGLRVYTKGAPGVVLARCSRIQRQEGVEVLDERQRRQIEALIHDFAGAALRVIACAYAPSDAASGIVEEGLIFVGLQAMEDPPRPDVRDSIQRAREAHIRPIMITGDHRETARAIGEQVGISGRVLSGKELDALDDQELEAALAEVNIFARVVPAHKLRLVKALQQAGHVVAMTGDGVNDAPALKKADIGIAVGSGTDVAKEAADFVLCNDSFANIVAAVEEGRGIYDNIQKSIMLLLSGNLMEVLLVVVAVLVGFNLPLTALMLLWINFVTDGAPALAYSVDPYGRQIMQRPPQAHDQGVLPAARLRLLLALGSGGALIGLICFALAGGNSADPAQLQRAQTLAFSYVVLFEMVLVFVIRRSYGVPWRSNPWLWWAVVLSVLFQGLVVYSPLNLVFGVVALEGADLLLLSASGAAFIALTLGVMAWFRADPVASSPGSGSG